MCVSQLLLLAILLAATVVKYRTLREERSSYTGVVPPLPASAPLRRTWRVIPGLPRLAEAICMGLVLSFAELGRIPSPAFRVWHFCSLRVAFG
jgi:hypothetical protein